MRLLCCRLVLTQPGQTIRPQLCGKCTKYWLRLGHPSIRLTLQLSLTGDRDTGKEWGQGGTSTPTEGVGYGSCIRPKGPLGRGVSGPPIWGKGGGGGHGDFGIQFLDTFPQVTHPDISVETFYRNVVTSIYINTFSSSPLLL